MKSRNLDILLKGKMPIGTVSTYGNVKYRKESEGVWKPIGKPKGSAGKEEKPQGGNDNKLSSKEKTAVEYVDTPDKLNKRFQEAIDKIGGRASEVFKGGKLDWEKKQMISRDGKYVMKWKTRFNPNAPEGEGNIQSSRGFVHIVKSKENKPVEKKEEQKEESNNQDKYSVAKEKLKQRLGYQ